MRTLMSDPNCCGPPIVPQSIGWTCTSWPEDEALLAVKRAPATPAFLTVDPAAVAY